MSSRGRSNQPPFLAEVRRKKRTGVGSGEDNIKKKSKPNPTTSIQKYLKPKTVSEIEDHFADDKSDLDSDASHVTSDGSHSDSEDSTSDTSHLDSDDLTENSNVLESAKKYSYKRIQKFKNEWSIKYPWAQPSPLGTLHYACSVCSQTYKCAQDGITSLKRHETRKSHIEKQKAVQAVKINLFERAKIAAGVEKRTRILELQAAMFVVSKNLPFSIADDFIDFLKGIDIDDCVQKKLRCRRTKCTALVCNVIGESSQRELITKLKTDKFSLIIDEATDINVTKHLAVCVRHPDLSSSLFSVTDSFLALLKVTDATHKGLFGLVKSFFEKHEIPFSNMIGFASDGANVMMGAHHSVVTELKKVIPRLFVMKCICHSLDLAVSKATRKLPSYLEELLINIFFYLKYSSKRQEAIGELQTMLNIPEHKILQLHKVRWLSLEAVINRTLEQFDVLTTFFDRERKDPKNEKAKNIYEKLQNPYTRLYFEFLSFVLKLVVKRNKEFQAEAPKIHLLYRQMLSFFKTILSMYLKEDYVDNTDVEFIEFEEKNQENAKYWENLLNIDIGPSAKADLYSLHAPLKDQESFRDTCRQFLVQLAKEVNLRFPFKNREVKLMENFQFVNPVNLKETKDITLVADFFGIDVEEADLEFKKLKKMFKDETKLEVIEFWEKVERTIHGDGSLEFPIILDIVRRVLLLPHSSANCERTFSQVNLLKTKVRNRLSDESLNGILYSKNLLKSKSSIFDVNFNSMLPLVSSDIYS